MPYIVNITSYHFYGNIGRKIQKQKVLGRRENGGACAAGAGNCLPDANRQRPALTCVLLPSIHFTIDIWQNWTENRRVAKIHRAMNEISAKMKSVAECKPTLFLAPDMFPTIPALPAGLGCGACGIESYDTKKKQGFLPMTIHFVLFW